MKICILFFISIILTILSPFLIMVTMYSLLNFINYIYVANVLGFLRGNIDYILYVFVLLFLLIFITKNNISKNVFKLKHYIILALIGQITICIVLLLVPIIILLLFNYAISQMYLYSLFKDFSVAVVFNILIVLFTTVFIFILASILPIKYTEKAIQIYNEKTDNKILGKLLYIRPIKMLIKIIKICIMIKKCPNVI